MTLLDDFAPVWQFHELHAIAVKAPPDRVDRAVRRVTAGEVRFFRALTWLRRFGRPCPASILNPPAHLPLFDIAIRSGFVLLADEPNREVVFGTVVIAPRSAQRPATPEAFRRLGSGKATVNFRIVPTEPARSVLTTETRVYATDARTRRRFRAYWCMIYPGSALIRRMWLWAIRRRAEDPNRAEQHFVGAVAPGGGSSPVAGMLPPPRRGVLRCAV